MDAITVITATIPGREDSLARTVESVNVQSVSGVHAQLIYSHRVTVQPAMLQYVTAKNTLLRIVETDWVAVLNDDDVWLPNHVETVLPHLHNADVLYTWDDGGSRPRTDCNGWTRAEFDKELQSGNFIDGNCLIRRRLLEKVGGFPVEWKGGSVRAGGQYEDSGTNYEDWELWRRLSGVGARFRCVPVVTWRYGMGEDRLSVT